MAIITICWPGRPPQEEYYCSICSRHSPHWSLMSPHATAKSPKITVDLKVGDIIDVADVAFRDNWYAAPIIEYIPCRVSEVVINPHELPARVLHEPIVTIVAIKGGASIMLPYDILHRFIANEPTRRAHED